jgi:hypothetical protein
MDNPFFKQSLKIDGLNHSFDFEKDKVDQYPEAHHRLEQEEEMKKTLLNKHLDPLYMETDLPDPPDTGSISLDPDDMTFNF